MQKKTQNTTLLITGLVLGLAVLGWHPGNGLRAAADRTPMRAAVVDSIDVRNLAGANVRIDDAVFTDGMLTVDVTYTGGCKVHEFALISDGFDTVLAHQDYGDACDTTVSESLRFDVSSLDAPALPPISVSDLPRS